MKDHRNRGEIPTVLPQREDYMLVEQVIEIFGEWLRT